LWKPLCQVFPCQPDPRHDPLREPLNVVLWKLLPWKAPPFDVLRMPLLVELRKVELRKLELRLPLNDEPLCPNDVPSV
jgi:hypothetical protein